MESVTEGGTYAYATITKAYGVFAGKRLIHTWALQGWGSHDGALYKSSYLYLLPLLFWTFHILQIAANNPATES